MSRVLSSSSSFGEVHHRSVAKCALSWVWIVLRRVISTSLMRGVTALTRSRFQR